jgi:hypothetical protein
MKALNDKKLWILIAVVVVIVALVYYFAKKKPTTESLVTSGTAATPKTTVPPGTNVNIFPLKMGSRGNEVTIVQQYINEKLKNQPKYGMVAALPLLVVDGIWGQKTQDAIKYKLGIDQIDYTYYTKIILGIVNL